MTKRGFNRIAKTILIPLGSSSIKSRYAINDDTPQEDFLIKQDELINPLRLGQGFVI